MNKEADSFYLYIDGLFSIIKIETGAKEVSLSIVPSKTPCNPIIKNNDFSMLVCVDEKQILMSEKELDELIIWDKRLEFYQLNEIKY